MVLRPASTTVVDHTVVDHTVVDHTAVDHTVEMTPSDPPTLGDALGGLAQRVPYLQAAEHLDDDDRLTASEVLTAADPLARLLGVDRTGRACRERAVAASSFFEGYAVRLVATSAAMWQLTGRVPDPSPASVEIAISFDLPMRIAFTTGWLDDGPDVLDRFAERSVERHLDLLAERITALVPIGHRLLWSNVAAAVATACLAVEATAGDDDERQRLRRAGEEFRLALPHDIAHLGGRLDLTTATGGRSVWERAACCLWYREDPSAAVCNSCPLLEPEDRHSRLAGAGPSAPVARLA